LVHPGGSATEGSSGTRGAVTAWASTSVTLRRLAWLDVGVHTVEATGIDVAFESFGPEGGVPMLLVMGLGTQMIAWPDALCADLADRGYRVVRFDNRDVGLSTHLTELRAPSPVDTLLRREPPPYTIDDMAEDAAGLMDGLGWGDAHVVGASMGGFIAQSMALRHRRRLRSLMLVMTSTGSRRVGKPTPRLAGRLNARRGVTDRTSAQSVAVETFRAIGSPGYAFDEEYVADLAGRSWDRAHDPGGYLRQLAAILAQPDRTAALQRLTIPATVIHGLDDPLIAPSGGLALARALRGSRFVGYSGMGHDLPRELWSDMADQIQLLADRADARS